MLLSIDKFPFIKEIIEHQEDIANEYAEAEKRIPELNTFFKDGMPEVFSHFDYWVKESGFHEEQIGYDSRGTQPVGAFPLYKTGFPVQWMDAEKEFPKTFELLNTVPRLTFAQFSIMSPGSEILPHIHHNVDTYIFHLCLFNLEGKAIFTAGDDLLEYSKAGDHFLFQPKENHGSKNLSENYRVNFMFEFEKLPAG